MSKYELQVMLDRKDRTYRFNEEVSGRVVLNTRAQLSCRKIWIDHSWRTHGKGNQDKGVGGRLVLLSKETQLQSGEHREFRFLFKAPGGPTTYHGQHLNVDWYVTAHLDLPRHNNIKKEQDFVLIVGGAPKEILLRNASGSTDGLPGRSQDVQLKVSADPDIKPGNPPTNPFFSKIVSGFGILLFVVIFFSSSLRLYALGLFLGFIALYELYAYVFPAILRADWKRRFEIHDLRVNPSKLHAGDRVSCHLQLETKRTLCLENIAAILIAEEVAVSDDGSSSTDYRHTAYKQSYVKTYTEKLMAGRLISFDCALPVSPGAPATFGSSHNDIKWSVKVKISFNRWPSWEKTIPITVLPG